MLLAGPWNDQWREALGYRIEEKGILRAQLPARRLRLTDADRHRLARRGYRLGRRLLCQVVTIVNTTRFSGGIDRSSHAQMAGRLLTAADQGVLVG